MILTSIVSGVLLLLVVAGFAVLVRDAPAAVSGIAVSVEHPERGPTPAVRAGAPTVPGEQPEPAGAATQNPTPTPPPGQSGTMAYDPEEGYTVYFGGMRNATWYSATWIYTSQGWSNITGTAGTPPSPRIDMSMTFDEADGYLLAYGGSTNQGQCNGYTTSTCNDTWEFSGGRWSQLNPTMRPVCEGAGATLECTPLPGGYCPVIYDAADGDVVMFAGGASTPVFATETWVFLSDTWTQLNRSTDVPASRTGEGFAYDASSSQAILFGGSAPGSGGWVEYNDTWSFQAGNWTNVSASVGLAPSPRAEFGLGYNPAAGELVFFGGLWARCDQFEYSSCVHGSEALLNDTWIFGSQGWQNVTVGPSPAPRGEAGFSGDSPNGSALLFGGSSNLSSVAHSLQDTWSWSGQTERWSVVLIPAPLEPPTILASPEAPIFGEPVAFSGLETGGFPPYTYAWSFGDGAVGGNLSNISHTYTTDGPFVVRLTVSDVQSDVASGFLNLTVLLQAMIHASTTAGAPPLAVRFSGSAVGGVPSYSFLWSFGDGTTGSNQTPITHTFTSPGVYVVNLTVSDQAGNRASAHLTIDVSTQGFLGLPGNDGYYLLGTLAGAAVAACIGIALVGRTRDRDSPRPPIEDSASRGFEGTDGPIDVVGPHDVDPAEDLL